MEIPPAVERPPTNSRSNNFGALRVLLATLVVVSHSAELMDGDRHREWLTAVFGTLSSGSLAVDGFFLISGFLINKSWVGDPQLGSFLRKRILRIYPGFAVASLLSVFLAGRLAASAPVSARRLVLPTLANIAKLDYPRYPAPLRFSHYPIVNGALWTIQGEFLCYLLAAAFGLLGLTKRRWPWLVLFPVALALMARNDVRGLGDSSELLLALPRFVAFFSAGALFYLYRDRIAFHPLTAALAGVVLTFAMLAQPYAQVGLATLGAYLLFSLAFVHTPAAARIGSRNDISYGLYLYAWPIQQLLLLFIPGLGLVPFTLVALASSGLMGLLSWRLIETPALQLKRRMVA